jgi:hypothetical protein|nr:MAG TPA: zinc finger domain-containing protein [Caudoviricetes sp.]
MKTEKIWCVTCNKYVDAELGLYGDIFPNRLEKAKLPIWICPMCGNYVLTHSKTYRPVGVIGNKQIRIFRLAIHKQLGKACQDSTLTIRDCYGVMSAVLGYKFHSGKLKTINEALKALKIASRINEKKALLETMKEHGRKLVLN